MVTPEAGIEINGQAERNDEIEYSIQAAIATRQTPTRDNLPRNYPPVRKPKDNGNLSSSYVRRATDQMGEMCSVEDDSTESNNETGLRSHACN